MRRVLERFSELINVLYSYVRRKQKRYILNFLENQAALKFKKCWRSFQEIQIQFQRTLNLFIHFISWHSPFTWSSTLEYVGRAEMQCTTSERSHNCRIEYAIKSRLKIVVVTAMSPIFLGKASFYRSVFCYIELWIYLAHFFRKKFVSRTQKLKTRL